MQRQKCSEMVGERICGREISDGRKHCPVHSTFVQSPNPTENRELVILTQKELDNLLWKRELSDLSHYDLSGLSLVGADLTGKHFVRTKLTGTDLRKANLRECLFSHNQLEDAKFEATDLQGAYFFQTDARKADFSDANLSGVFFNEVDLRCTVFQDTLLTACRMLKVNGSQADFARANLSVSVIEESYFVEADFQKANLQKGSLLACDLRDGNLTAADLERADLRHAILAGCKLRLANFDRTKLFRKSFSGSFYEEAQGQLIETWEIYNVLKSNFSGIGRHEDARWAHIQERRYKRRTFAPKYAWKCYSDDELPLNQISWLQWWWSQAVKPYWFIPKYTFLWLLFWVADIISGFGELPSHVIAWGVLVVGVFSFLFNIDGVLAPATLPVSPLERYMKALIYSCSAFFTVDLTTVHTSQGCILGDILTTIEGGLGIAWFGLLLYTLGNRISKS